MKRGILPLVNMIVLLALVLCSNKSQAQGTSVAKRAAPYYIDLNNAAPGKVYDVRDEMLSLEYRDSYGTWKEVPFRIYDWKHELVGSAALGKTFGLNHFTVRLNELNTSWETGKVYVCRFEDESGRKYELPIRIASPAKTAGPVIDIVVNPLAMKCDGLSASVAEFYGNVKGGKAPYTINWVITNSNRTDLLYQPREEVITTGRSSVITVDKAPDYYVLLQVKDACGNVEQKMVHLMCGERKKKVSTIFVEPLQIKRAKDRIKNH